MDLGGFGWLSAEVIGVIALGAVLIWVIVRQRGGPRSDPATERATRDLYAEEEQRHDAGTDTKPD